MSEIMTPDQQREITAAMIEFIRRPETTIVDLARWIVDRGLDVTFKILEADDPAKPGSFYVNGELAMTHEEWISRP